MLIVGSLITFFFVFFVLLQIIGSQTPNSIKIRKERLELIRKEENQNRKII